MTPRPQRTKRGGTLLELMATLAITATLMGSATVVMRSSYSAWMLHRDDAEQVDSADTFLRHLVKTARQADSVGYLHNGSGGSASTAYLMFRTPDDIEHWYVCTSGVGYYYTQLTVGGSYIIEDLNEGHIDAEFTCYEADGVTPTTTLSDIQLVHASIQMPNASGSPLTYSTFAWLRSW